MLRQRWVPVKDQDPAAFHCLSWKALAVQLLVLLAEALLLVSLSVVLQLRLFRPFGLFAQR